MSDFEKNKGILIVFSAPSGTGKTTVCSLLETHHPELKFSVSHTTRSPRPTEQNGVHYHFISKEEFLEMRRTGEFLEWAQVHDEFYGTARKMVDEHRERGEDLILELDVQGAASVRQLGMDAVFILLMPPSLAELERRLVKRDTESPEKIAQRLLVGKTEIADYFLYDYIVVNHQALQATESIMSIVRAEKCKTKRYTTDCPEIQKIIHPKS